MICGLWVVNSTNDSTNYTNSTVQPSNSTVHATVGEHGGPPSAMLDWRNHVNRNLEAAFLGRCTNWISLVLQRTKGQKLEQWKSVWGKDGSWDLNSR